MVDIEVAAHGRRKAFDDGGRFGKLQRLAAAGADKVNVFTVHGDMAFACFHIHVSVGVGGANEAVRFQRSVQIDEGFLPEELVVYPLKRTAGKTVLFVKVRPEAAAAAGDGMLV